MFGVSRNRDCNDGLATSSTGPVARPLQRMHVPRHAVLPANISTAVIPPMGVWDIVATTNSPF